MVKAWATEASIDTASLGIQVHGGMGYVEETGAAQHLRDARITTIYEGTTGIQSLDLVGRKLLRDRGAAAGELIADMRISADALAGDWARIVGEAADLIQSTLDWALAQEPSKALSAATNIQEIFGLCLGAWIMGDTVRAATARIEGGDTAPYLTAKLALAKVYATHVLPKARACYSCVVDGADAILDLSPSALRANDMG